MSGKPIDHKSDDQSIFSILSSLGSGIVESVSKFLNLNQDNGKKDDINIAIEDLFCCFRGPKSEQENSVKNNVDKPSSPRKDHSLKPNDLFFMFGKAKNKLDQDLERFFKPVRKIAHHFCCCRRREEEKKKSDVSFDDVNEVDDKGAPTGNGNEPSGPRLRFARDDKGDGLWDTRSTVRPLLGQEQTAELVMPVESLPRKRIVELAPLASQLPPPLLSSQLLTQSLQTPNLQPVASEQSTTRKDKSVESSIEQAQSPTLNAPYTEYPFLYKGHWGYKRSYDLPTGDLLKAVRNFEPSEEIQKLFEQFRPNNSSTKDLIIYQYEAAQKKIDVTEDGTIILTNDQIKLLKQYYQGEEFSSNFDRKAFFTKQLTRIKSGLQDKKTTPIVIEDKIIRLCCAMAIIDKTKIEPMTPATYCGVTFSFPCFPSPAKGRGDS